MQMMMNEQATSYEPRTRSMTRAQVEAVASVRGNAVAIRDTDGRLMWCNEDFSRLSHRSAAELIGTTLHEVVCRPAADERLKLYHEASRTGRTIMAVQLLADKRMLTDFVPLPPEEYGRPAVACVLRCPPPGMQANPEWPLRLIVTTGLDTLDQLSPRELDILHAIAEGKSNPTIAEQFSRSARTIERHIDSIREKLQLTSRAELVRFCVERGIQGFTPDEWESIVEGALKVRRVKASRVRQLEPVVRQFPALVAADQN